MKHEDYFRKSAVHNNVIYRICSRTIVFGLFLFSPMYLHVSVRGLVCCETVMVYVRLSSLPHSHACVIRGQVVTSDGTPLVGVNISFINNPSYGYTVTRQDGR